MANPQLENGYTPIANETMEALCRIRIPGEARQILDVIIRKTYGWRKKQDVISLSQFVESTGINKPHIIDSIKKLRTMNLITEKGKGITDNGNDVGKVFEFNKDFETWQPLPKKGTLPKKVKAITEKGKKPLPLSGTTKESFKYSLKEILYIVEQTVFYLNNKTGKNFSPKTKSTKTMLTAKLREGRTYEDFCKVIDTKCEKWLPDPKMVDYLRPETLFGNKFEAYLNEDTQNGQRKPLEGNRIPEYKGTEIPVSSPAERERGKQVLQQIRLSIEKNQA